MSRLEQLEAQQAALAKEIADEKAVVRGAIVDEVRALIKKYDITLSEVKNVLTMRKPRSKNAAAAKPTDGTPKKRGRPRKS